MRLEVVQGDITTFAVDAIVNAANEQLQHGGGVAKAISLAAGPELQTACYDIPTVATGDAVMTSGYRLPAKHVIHAVGPIWRGGTQNEPMQLFKAYYRSVQLAAEAGLKTIAFPSISTGIYGYPLEDAVEVAVAALLEALADFPMIEKVTIVTFSQADLVAYTTATDSLDSTLIEGENR
jgi:O-acetyl-ADP-ribose deacetylase (regulator of RNase III)